MDHNFTEGKIDVRILGGWILRVNEPRMSSISLVEQSREIETRHYESYAYFDGHEIKTDQAYTGSSFDEVDESYYVGGTRGRWADCEISLDNGETLSFPWLRCDNEVWPYYKGERVYLVLYTHQKRGAIARDLILLDGGVFAGEPYRKNKTWWATRAGRLKAISLAWADNRAAMQTIAEVPPCTYTRTFGRCTLVQGRVVSGNSRRHARIENGEEYPLPTTKNLKLGQVVTLILRKRPFLRPRLLGWLAEETLFSWKVPRWQVARRTHKEAFYALRYAHQWRWHRFHAYQSHMQSWPHLPPVQLSNTKASRTQSRIS